MDAKDRVIARIYRGKDGGQPPRKTWLDAKAIDPSITLDWVKSWFRLNIKPAKQVGGAKNSYVAPHAYFEYQADLFFISSRQFPDQEFKIGMAMIDVFSKFAVVIPIRSRYAKDVLPAIFK